MFRGAATMQKLGALVGPLGLRLIIRQYPTSCLAFGKSRTHLQLQSCCTDKAVLVATRDFSPLHAATPEAPVRVEQDARQPLARIKPKDMIAMFTCNVCKTRSAKMISKHTYETGVVIVTCPGCNGKHLIADRKGWFGKPGSVENYLQDKGEEAVKRTMDGTTQLTAEDLMGWSKAAPGATSP